MRLKLVVGVTFAGVNAQVEGVSEKFPEEILVNLNDRSPIFHDLHRININTGTDVTGFPVDLSVSPQYQNERAALALANGHVYVAFGGWLGDCGTYHPAVVSVPVTDRDFTGR